MKRNTLQLFLALSRQLKNMFNVSSKKIWILTKDYHRNGHNKKDVHILVRLFLGFVEALGPCFYSSVYTVRGHLD